jgi:hypothetical protein
VGQYACDLLNSVRREFAAASPTAARNGLIAPTYLMRPNELTVQQLAERLRVSTHVVYYWIDRRVVEARKLDGRGAWWITLDASKEHNLQDWVRTSGHLKPQHSNTQL